MTKHSLNGTVIGSLKHCISVNIQKYSKNQYLIIMSVIYYKKWGSLVDHTLYIIIFFPKIIFKLQVYFVGLFVLNYTVKNTSR